MSVPDRLRSQIREHAEAVAATDALVPQLADITTFIERALSAGGRVLVFGNGGSAADAQHFAAELVGRGSGPQRPLAAIALTTDTSVITAIGNDRSFLDVFARQVTALASRGDVAIGISTSGRSENVLRGLRAARDAGATTVAFTGAAGLASPDADHVVAVPSRSTPRVQEVHALMFHMIWTELEVRSRERD